MKLTHFPKGLIPLLLVASMPTLADAREWTDTTGLVKIQGTMLAADDKEVVIKLDKRTRDHELLAVPIEQLCKADQDFILSGESAAGLQADGSQHVWELKNGTKVFGKIVRFVRKDVALQRRRGKLYVNDRPIDNLPEVYQKMIPHIVEYFEKTKFEDKRQFNSWIERQKANVKSYACEGVMIEFPNGDEYAVPLFFLSDKAIEVLKPAYDKWQSDLAAKKDEEQAYEQQRQHDLYLQSQAAAMQQHQQEMLQVARLQLLMNSVSAGVTDLWEVYLYPPIGSNAFPISVVVPGRSSDQASIVAMQNNPGYRVGPVRRISGF